MNYTVDQALQLLAERQRENWDAPKRLEAEIMRDRRQLERLVDAVAEGKPRRSAREDSGAGSERRREGAQARHVAKALPMDSEIARIKRAFDARLDHCGDLLLSGVPLARQALRKLIVGRIEFKPEHRKGERS